MLRKHKSKAFSNTDTSSAPLSGAKPPRAEYVRHRPYTKPTPVPLATHVASEISFPSEILLQDSPLAGHIVQQGGTWSYLPTAWSLLHFSRRCWGHTSCSPQQHFVVCQDMQQRLHPSPVLHLLNPAVKRPETQWKNWIPWQFLTCN